MNIPRELTINEVYAGLVELTERLHHTCELAQCELQKSLAKQQKYHNQNTMVKTFQADLQYVFGVIMYRPILPVGRQPYSRNSYECLIMFNAYV